MHQTFRQRKSLQVARERRADLSAFTPVVSLARIKVDSLLAAGARVLAVYPDKVVLRRQDSVATVDDCGRVSWGAAARRASRNADSPR